MIKIKLTQSEFAELYRMYRYHVDFFTINNGWDELLFEHMADLYKRLAVLRKEVKPAYTIKLSGPESLAFYEVWQMINTNNWPFGNVILIRIIAQIDKEHHKARPEIVEL